MSCFTISDNIKESICFGKKYITELLYVFLSSSNSFKVSLDTSDVIIDIYSSVARKDEFFSNWLTLMSHEPSNFEKIDIDVSSVENKEEVFLKVCSKTKAQQKMIVHSHESWSRFNYLKKNIISYNGKNIIIFDRDEAIIELSKEKGDSYTNISAKNSIIATGGSKIQNSDN